MHSIARLALIALLAAPTAQVQAQVQTETEEPVTIPESEGLAPSEPQSDQSDDPLASGPESLDEGMTLEVVGEILRRLDPDAAGAPDNRVMQFTIGETRLLFVSDPIHNRMRLMSPIRPAEGLDAKALLRIAQANFDSALDARYAVAQGTLWSVYIHPLRELDEAQLIAAVGQVVNAATSYGTSYSSGLLSYGGGDSALQRQRDLIDELLKRGQPI
ncbi:MAG: hypothetical protein AAGF76_08425 [Pseudomonadota bacterium]